MEPLKKVQVEGYIMFAEPEVLFGNLDELCCVSWNFTYVTVLTKHFTILRFQNFENDRQDIISLLFSSGDNWSSFFRKNNEMDITNNNKYRQSVLWSFFY